MVSGDPWPGGRGRLENEPIRIGPQSRCPKDEEIGTQNRVDLESNHFPKEKLLWNQKLIWNQPIFQTILEPWELNQNLGNLG